MICVSGVQAYKAVVNDATIFKLELPMKQKGLVSIVSATQCCFMFVIVFFCLQTPSVGMKTQPESKCPELLANYCDMLLRKTPLSKKLASEEIELKLKEVVSFCAVSQQERVPAAHRLFSCCSSWC